jgi:hypothetical protein
MPRVAYAQPGALPSAFAPVPAWDGRGFGPWSGTADVSGQPGTQGVPVGLPDFGRTGQQVNGTPVRGGGAGYAQGSGTMPGAWYPQLWHLTQLDGSTLVSGNTQTPSIYSDNQLPIPAADPLGRAALLARPPVFLSGGNLEQPRNSRVPGWPRWLPSMSYGG